VKGWAGYNFAKTKMLLKFFINFYKDVFINKHFLEKIFFLPTMMLFVID